MEKLQFKNVTVVLQEIPNEISLCFSITGCKLACDGCHSSYLWKNTGKILTDELFIDYLIKYNNVVTTILFMGGEWKMFDLLNKLELATKYGYNTALYTGLTLEELKNKDNSIINKLNYVKTGRWIKTLGGLNSIITNQELINLKTNEKLNKYFI